jgi:hypothetical protein
MTRLVVEVQCGEKACGRCHHVSPFRNCRAFLDEGYNSPSRVIDGQPQRCAACLRAEKEASDAK